MSRGERGIAVVRTTLDGFAGWAVAHAARLMLGAVAVRAVLAVLAQGHGSDQETYRTWGRALRNHPIADFYAVVPDADHLPGDLWLHAALAHLADPDSAAYPLLLKGVPILADLVIAVALLVMVGRFAGRRAGRASALAYLWCPAPVLVGAVWGQWDQVSIAILIAAVALAIEHPHRLWPAAALATWALLIKPQLALGVVVVLLVAPSGRRLANLLARAAIPALVTAVLLCGPFGVGLTSGARWSLADRLTAAADRYTGVSLGAPNLWTILMPGWHLDDELFLGIPARVLGHVLLAVVLAAAVLLARHAMRTGRMTRPAAAAWAVMIALGGFFMLETRNHERYFMPWLVASILWAALARPLLLRRTLPVVVLGVTTALTVLASQGSLWPGDWRDVTYRILAPIQLVILGILLWLGAAALGRGWRLDLRHGQTQARPPARHGLDGDVGVDRPVRRAPAGARGAGGLSG